MLAKWRAWLKGQERYPFFFTPEWYRACAGLPGGRKEWGAFLLQTDEGEALFPYLISRRGPLRVLYSAPRGGYGGLLGGPSPRLWSPLLKEVLRRSGVGFFYLVLPPDAPAEPLLRSAGCRILHKETHLFRLPDDPEEILRRFQPERRRQVRKCRREGGLQVEEGKGYLPAFLRLFHRHAWAGRTPASFLQALAGSPKSRLFALTREGAFLAGALVLEGKREAFLYLLLVDRERTPHCGRAFFVAELLRRYGERGFCLMDFGASPTAGIRAFKESFGAAPSPVHHITNIPRPILRLINR